MDVNHEEVLTDDLPESETAEPVETGNEAGPETGADQPNEETPAKPEESGEFDWDNGDPNKLPPEVQKYYKGMQASFTRKMQGLSQAFEGLKSHSTRLQMLDRAIAGDPEAQAQLAKFVSQKPATSEPDIPNEFSDTKHLVSYFDQRVAKAIESAMQHIGQQIAPIQQQSAYQQQMAEYQATKAKYPDFDTFIPQMIDIRNRMPGLPLEDAYKLATYKTPVPPTKLVSKPGARPSAVKSRDDGKPMSWEESAAAAIRELKKGG